MQKIVTDSEFRDLVEEGTGFIYNDYSGHGSTGAQYNILHRSSCGSLRQQAARVTGYYSKYFAETLAEATDWLDDERASNWKTCGMCLRDVGPGTSVGHQPRFSSTRVSTPRETDVESGPELLDASWIKRHVRAYNAVEEYSRTDFLIGGAFDHSPTLEVVKERARLIDQLWHANLRYHTPGHEQVAEWIFDRANSTVTGEWESGRSDLRGFDLSSTQDQEALLVPVEAMLKAVGKNVISFTTKYLHWAYPTVFPPHDSQVLRSAALVLGTSISDQAPWRTAYMRVLRANQKMWKQVNDEEMEELLLLDFTTQPSRFKRKLFPLRILDKALWMAGAPGA